MYFGFFFYLPNPHTKHHKRKLSPASKGAIIVVVCLTIWLTVASIYLMSINSLSTNESIVWFLTKLVGFLISELL